MNVRGVRHQRRGFAAITALFLVTLVGAALLALTSLMTTDARRATRAATDAQLRQLLHAGAVAAVARLREPGELPEWSDVALPRELSSAGAAVRISRAVTAPNEFRLLVHAQLDHDGSAAQQFILVRDGESWRVRSVAR
jgi:hypothetical protein